MTYRSRRERAVALHLRPFWRFRAIAIVRTWVQRCRVCLVTFRGTLHQVRQWCVANVSAIFRRPIYNSAHVHTIVFRCRCNFRVFFPLFFCFLCNLFRNLGRFFCSFILCPTPFFEERNSHSFRFASEGICASRFPGQYNLICSVFRLRMVSRKEDVPRFEGFLHNIFCGGV